MKKIVLVGNMCGRKTNGPRAVMQKLSETMDEMGVETEKLFLEPGMSKIKYIIYIIISICFSRNKSVNVHTEGFLLPMLIFLISRVNRHNTYFLTVHGVYAIEAGIYGTDKSIYKYLERVLYKYFDNIICVSKMLKLNIIKVFHRKNRIVVIGNGTDAVKYSKDNAISKDGRNCLRFISVGGINVRKGINELLELIDYLVNKNNIDVNVDIYGGIQNKDIEQAFYKYLEEHNLTDSIRYRGYISDKQELYQLYTKYDFHLCLSRYDTFNVAIIESMVMGCPCICSNMCGAKDFISSDNGLVVSLEDDYKTNIHNFLKKTYIDTNIYRQMCVAAKNIDEYVNWQYITKQYMDLLER